MSSKKRDKREGKRISHEMVTQPIIQRSSTHVNCKLCLKEISIVNMGEAALKFHAKENPSG